jgi:hypothetical protein
LHAYFESQDLSKSTRDAVTKIGTELVLSPRVTASGTYGGGGWIIDPAGELWATTSASETFVTQEIDLLRASAAKHSYPQIRFGEHRSQLVLATGADVPSASRRP